ncbi:hypothetical protein [Glaciibacter psychrotolerans]|uniref:DNA-directed RNA polymerase specialized sigma24 family protein n=1 Tax=Glaciibacter psychrotolerans TaxID=670054 RepID=A0A7Z0ED71_9MICO|nr:hypothetical protein [Leifsonia psychrotolerans]NYJ19000.1 DNA-directed RNA polymerase specialized sigma24 family protein [Leifsonia psychrotolerans]
MGHFLAPHTVASLARLTELDATGQGNPVERLAAIRALLTELDADPATLASVRAAQGDGANWDEIAAAAGLGVAAAKWRWQGSDDEISARHDAGRKRAARPSSVPTDLPGVSVAEAAKQLGVSAQAIYLRISRGTLESRTVELPDGRQYKRVFIETVASAEP